MIIYIRTSISDRALALSSLSWFHTIFTSHTLMQRGQNRGVTFPSPFNSIVLNAYKIWTKCYIGTASVFCRIEKKWMCQSHGILQLPHSLFKSVVLPLHLYLPYGSVPEHCDLPVEDAHWLDLEFSLGFHLNHIPIYHMVRIMYISLKQRNMKNIMSPSASRQCKSICNWPYSFKHFKWPTIYRRQLGTTSKLQGTLPFPHSC